MPPSAGSDFQPPIRSSVGQRLLAIAAVVAVCLMVYLPGLATIPPVDRDESRFAQASRQMAEGRFPGDWVVPRVQEEPRLNKPPVIYWLQASSALAFTGGAIEHDAIWMYRVPSVLAAIVAAVATLLIGTSMFGLRCGMLAAVLLAIAPVVVFDAHQARADEVLLAVTVLAVACLWRLWRHRRDPRLPKRWTTLLWLLIGVGVLVKGPVTPVVVGGAAAALAFASGNGGWLWRLRPLGGMAIAAATAVPWLALAAAELGWEPLWSRIVEETIGRASSPMEGHSGPPGMHLVLLVALFWPGSLLAGLGIVRGFRVALKMPDAGSGGRLARLRARWRSRRVGRSSELFLLAWLLPGWLAFEIAATKLPHYTLPMYPAIALLSARGLVAASRGWSEAATRLSRFGFGLWAVLGGLMVLAPAAIAAMAIREGWFGGAAAAAIPSLLAVADHHAWLALASLLACVLIVGISVRMILGGRVLAGQLLALVPAVAALQVTFGSVLPGLAHVWISPRVMGEIDRLGAAGRPLAAVAFHEDSLVHLTRGRIARIGEGEIDAWLAANPDGVVLAPATLVESRPGLRPLADGEGPPPPIVGWNYSKGERVELRLAEAWPP